MELRLGPKRVKASELTVMSRQLATMISSGMTLLRAFYVLEEQIENQLLRETVAAVREDIEAGLSFSDALERHPKVFSPLYVAMVRAGEAGGVLEESLERISDQLEKDDSLRRQVKSAMAYPIVRLQLRDARPDRHDRVHRPRVRGRVQGLRRRAAADHEASRSASRTSSPGSGTSCSRSRSAASSASASGRAPRGAARSGTSSACGSRSRSARPSRRSRSRAGRARSPRSTARACRSCRRSR